MKALVTGASGFIGTHLVKALEDRGDEVTKLERQGGFGYVDLGKTLYELKPDYIFHLAAYGNMANQKEGSKIFEANLGLTFNLLELSKFIPYKAFINVSSSSVLLGHETIYSATKAGAERLVRAFSHEYGKPTLSIRPTSVFGPGEADLRFIPTVFRSCLKGEEMGLDPNPVHDWVYIDDVVQGLLYSVMEASTNGGWVQLGTGIKTTNQDIVEMIEKITGKKAIIKEKKHLRSFDTKSWISNKEWNLRGWTLKTTLYEGLEKYYHWYTGLSK